MAGDWIPVETATPRKSELLKFARLAGIPRHEALGILVELWTWADGESVDGHVDADVDQLANIIGTTPKVLRALIGAEWLVDNGDGSLTLPNAERWLGRSAKARLRLNRKQARWRERQNGAATVGAHVDGDVDQAGSLKGSTTEEKSIYIKERSYASKEKARRTRKGSELPEERKPGRVITAEDIKTDDLGETLSGSESFLDLWNRWKIYLFEKCAEKRNSLNVQTLNMQILDLRRMGVDRACATLKTSMEGGWMKLAMPIEGPQAGRKEGESPRKEY